MCTCRKRPTTCSTTSCVHLYCRCRIFVACSLIWEQSYQKWRRDNSSRGIWLLRSWGIVWNVRTLHLGSLFGLRIRSGLITRSLISRSIILVPGWEKSGRGFVSIITRRVDDYVKLIWVIDYFVDCCFKLDYK